MLLFSLDCAEVIRPIFTSGPVIHGDSTSNRTCMTARAAIAQAGYLSYERYLSILKYVALPISCYCCVCAPHISTVFKRVGDTPAIIRERKKRPIAEK